MFGGDLGLWRYHLNMLSQQTQKWTQLSSLHYVSGPIHLEYDLDFFLPWPPL